MQIHVGVVLHVGPDRAIEVPEPVRSKDMAAWPPESLVPFIGESSPGLHQFGWAAHVKREVFTALHERWRLDTEESVMLLAARGTHEGPYAGKPVSCDKSEAIGIERFELLQVWHEIDDVGQGPRFWISFRVCAKLVGRALCRSTWRVHGFARQREFAANR